MAHSARHEVAVALQSVEGAGEQPVRLSLPVDVRRQKGLDAVSGTQEGRQAVILDRLSEAHESTAAPGTDGNVVGTGHIRYR